MKCPDKNCGGEICIYQTQLVELKTDDDGQVVERKIIHDDKGTPTGMDSPIQAVKLVKVEARCNVCDTEYKLEAN